MNLDDPHMSIIWRVKKIKFSMYPNGYRKIMYKYYVLLATPLSQIFLFFVVKYESADIAKKSRCQ